MRELVSRGCRVKALVRDASHLPDEWRQSDRVEVVEAYVLDLKLADWQALLQECAVVVSCLGHNLSLRGIFAPPWRLVTESVRRVCTAAREMHREQPIRFLLMNSAGVQHRGQAEPLSFSEKLVLGLIRLLVPPHADNEQAAEYLRAKVGESYPHVQWCVVRPDSLTNDESPDTYEVFTSPQRSALFNPGKTSRANVARFLADLITQNETWQSWRGQMPVVYNRET